MLGSRIGVVSRLQLTYWSEGDVLGNSAVYGSIRMMSVLGTNPTYLSGLTMSVDRGTPEGAGPR